MPTAISALLVFRFQRIGSAAGAAAHRLTRLAQASATEQGLVVGSQLSLRLSRGAEGWLSRLTLVQRCADAKAAQRCVDAVRWWVDGELATRVSGLSVTLVASATDCDGTLITPPWPVSHLSLRDARCAGAPNASALRDLTTADLSHSTIANLGLFAELPLLETLICQGTKSLELTRPVGGNLWPSLKHLDLQHCEQLGDMRLFEEARHLEVVNVEFCCGLDDVEVIRGFPHLRELRATGTYISNLTCVTACPQIEHVTAGYNAVLSDFSPLGSAPCLKAVHVGRTTAHDVCWAAACASLESLDISHTAVEDLTPLACAKNMKELIISSTRVTCTDCLEQLASLEILCMNNCHSVGDLSSLTNLINLKVFQGSALRISDLEFLRKCLRLHTLHLANCSLIEKVEPLCDLEKLEYIDISGTAVRSLEPLRHCSALKHVNISRCPHIEDLSPLAGASNLRFLKADNTAVSDVSCLCACPRLSTLLVGYCRNLRSLSPLVDHPSLSVVDCSNSPVQDCAQLDTCPQLKWKSW